ncbi:uncharacterized protein LOC143470187 [Clavelina lepadiformis]|uniref:uncharacterized protein LOC143470187 n=1 Tax=Clavelina lepadiformis TaxID=159417 RepID=UPI0040427585
MASRSFPPSSNFAGGRTSLEEARRNHLKALHQCRRARFHNNLTDEASNENKIKENNNAHQTPNEVCNLSYGPGCSEGQRQSDTSAQPSGYHTEPGMRNHPNYYRRYSIASYQPLCMPQMLMPVYYPAQNGMTLMQMTQALDNRQHIGKRQSSEGSVENDDDVFAPVELSSSTTTSTLPFPLPTPYSPARLQRMETRKRARSAGDMVGLCLPESPGFAYPGTPTFGSMTGPSPSSQVIPSSPQLYYSCNPSGYQPPPNKRRAVNLPDAPTGDSASRSITVLPHGAQNSSRCNQPPHAPPNERLANYLRNSCTSNIIIRNSSPAAVPCNGVTDSSFKPSNTRKDNPDLLTDISRNLCTTSSTQPPLRASSTKKNSSLKSSMSSKSRYVKKNVVWNDLEKEKSTRKNGGRVVVHDSTDTWKDKILSDLDVEAIKKNPSKFTAQNRIGPYFIGQKLGNCTVNSISQYLVRKAGTNKYYLAKILDMDNGDVKSGKMLLHTEHSLLSALSTHTGVIHQHGMFKDCCFDATNQKVSLRVGLILDCLIPHQFNLATWNYLNLQQHVVNGKRLSEQEVIRIFYSIVTVVHSLHKSNVVHRDLKLSNMVMDKRTRRVILTNFCLGCQLTADRDLLTDQKGSPAYISPDVLSDKPYAGKPSDMWSLGVVFYMMLYKQFPFYDQERKKLYAKIKAADYSIPSDIHVSTNSIDIIRGLFNLNPAKRLTAAQTLAALERCVAPRNRSRTPSAQAQVVPDIDDDDNDYIKSGQHNDVDDTNKMSLRREEELTRAFKEKMLSDDEEENDKNFVAAAPKRKRSGDKSLKLTSEVLRINRGARPITRPHLVEHHRTPSGSRPLLAQ